MTKIYVDGFKVDDIELPDIISEGFREIAFTAKVKELIGDRKVTVVEPIPVVDPKFIMIYTVL